ncbi:hypothetical protein LCGC14_0769570 [marine sediment metagenome]|uniref:Uncharacterized protein n=1 Tax=marine sediment metagenome TaxID=412755 RepID=A0A0F9PYT6_9ZZZZ
MTRSRWFRVQFVPRSAILGETPEVFSREKPFNQVLCQTSEDGDESVRLPVEEYFERQLSWTLWDGAPTTLQLYGYTDLV